MITAIRNGSFLATIFLAGFSSAQTTAPATLTGRVIGITDGDTISVLVDGKPLKVRLDGIDAPEMGQPLGKDAKARLSDLCFGKDCKLIVAGTDRYGRTLVKVGVGSDYANRDMLTHGMAWHFVRYNRDPVLAQAQLDAMRAKRGVWGHDSSIPPWDWRNNKKLDDAGEPLAAVMPKASPRQRGASNETAFPSSLAPKPAISLSHWLNTNTGVRHQSGCRWYGDTKNGRACSAAEGKACKVCGG